MYNMYNSILFPTSTIPLPSLSLCLSSHSSLLSSSLIDIDVRVNVRMWLVWMHVFLSHFPLSIGKCVCELWVTQWPCWNTLCELWVTQWQSEILCVSCEWGNDHAEYRVWVVSDTMTMLKYRVWVVSEAMTMLKCRVWVVSEALTMLKYRVWVVSEAVAMLKYRVWVVG